MFSARNRPGSRYVYWVPDMTTSAYEFLLQKLDGFIRKYYLNQLVRGSIYLAAVLLISYLIFITCEYFGYFSSTVRGLFFYGFLGMNAVVFVLKVLPPLMHFLQLGKRISHEQASEIIGTHFTDVKDKLLNVLQLHQQMGDGHQQSLIEASINQKLGKLQPIPFSSAIRLRDNKRYLGWALAPLGVVVIIGLTAPSIISDGTTRLVNYNRFYAPKAPFQFKINSSLSATQGDDLPVDVLLSGDEFPDEVFLNDGTNTFKLDKKSIGRFNYTFRNVQHDVRFKLIGNEFSSEGFMLHVKRKPELLNADAELLFPAYIKRKNQTVNNAGDLTVPAGTTIRWYIQTKNTDKIGIAPTLPRQQSSVNGSRFLFSGYFTSNTHLVFSPQNAESGKTEPVSYRIAVIPDQSPVISVVEKPDSISTKNRYFSGQVQDDYGFSRLVFHYTVKRENASKPKMYQTAVPVSVMQNTGSFFYNWNLNTLNAQPGDEVSYYFEVWDNDGVNGAKSARSSVFTLAVPTKNEVQKQLDNGAKSVQQKMQAASRLASELEKDARKISRNLLDKKELSYEEKKQVEDLLNKRKELEALMKDIQQENQKNSTQRNELTEQDESLKEKQKELDELFNKTLNDETKELLKNIQKLLEQNAKEQTQEQMGKMQTDNKLLQKELERMKELYKQLAFEQKLNDQINQLEQLSAEQKKLAEQTRSKQKEAQSAKTEQQKLNKDFEQVKQAMKDLEQQNKSLEKENNFDSQKEEQKQISDQMKQSEEQLQKNQPQKAAQNQQNAAQQMQQMAKKMQQNQQQGASQQLNINIGDLRQLLDNLVTSSFEQEKTMQKLRVTTPSDPLYTQLAQVQKNIQDNLKNVQDSLFSLSKRVPQIQTAVNKETGIINERIQSALDNMGERQTAEAVRDQQYAMTSLNNLALMLNEALDQLQNMMKNAGSSGKTKQPSLSQLPQMQQQLNQNMQKAREQMQKEGNEGKSGQSGNSQNQSEQFARMARQQQQIREALKKIGQAEAKNGNNAGELNKIQQQMEQTENELVNKQLTDEMLRRQNDIRIKMLDADKARKERDQDKERESGAGKDFPPGRQKAWVGYKTEQQKQFEQLRTLTPQISPFYKSKINAYFEQLNKSLP